MKFGLTEETITKINSVFMQYPEIEKVILYGSRAMGTYRNGSDIDITFFGENLTLRTLYKIEIEIDDILTPYMFDMCLFSHIDNDDLIDHINRVGKVFYKKTISTSAV